MRKINSHGSAGSTDIVPEDGVAFAKPNKKALVVRRNELIFGRSKMSLQEMRLFLWLISEIKQGDEDFRPYRISVHDFCDLVGLEGGSMFSELKAITRSMISRVIELNDPETAKTAQYAMVSSAVYHNKQGFVDIKLHPELKPFLLQVKDHFTSIELGIAVRLKSLYSIRLYEVLKAENFKGDVVKFTLEELRNQLGIEVDQYDRFNNLKARVLDPASKEVSARTDLSVNYSVERQGRAVNEVVFNVAKRALNNELLDADEAKLVRSLRSVGMPESEALRAVEKWGTDPERVLWHVAEAKSKNTPLAWLRAGLKKDYRPKGLPKVEREKERRLQAEEIAHDQMRKAREHDGSDSELMGDLLNRIEQGRKNGHGNTIEMEV